MENKLNLILNKDCMDYLKEIPDNFFDLIIADFPYNIGKDYGNNSDRVNHLEYIKLINLWINEFFRVLKPNGTLFAYTGKQYYAYYYIAIEDLMTIQNQIIWSYDSSSVQAKTKYGSLYEPIIWATKDKKKYTFNKEFAMVEAKTGSKRKLIDYRKNPPRPYNSTKVDGDVWNFTRVRYKMAEYTNHPTQKPLSICNRIIKVHSNKEDIIFIPFAGSGSEIISCIENNRSYLATELNNNYIEDIIIPRINNLKSM